MNKKLKIAKFVFNYVGWTIVVLGCFVFGWLMRPIAPTVEYEIDTNTYHIQEWLNSHGYDCGQPDGILGSKTIAAMERAACDVQMTSPPFCNGETNK